MQITENAIGAVLSDLNETTTAYFSAPIPYLGKKLASYGGSLRYTIFYSIGNNGSAVAEPDVIIQGSNLFQDIEQVLKIVEFHQGQTLI